MALRIEEYALLGDTQTAALVGNDGSIDWLCLPRFDSPACFAALLGDSSHGRWLIAPEGAGHPRASGRRYRRGTLVLESDFRTEGGEARLVDFMPARRREADLVRVVEGVAGTVRMRMELVLRFDYGSIVPWVRRVDGALRAVAGPDSVHLYTPVATRGAGLTTCAEFTVRAGERIPFVLTWLPSHEPVPPPLDGVEALADTEAWWREWSDRCAYEGPWREDVLRSLIVLKALTFAPTGGVVAAPTTSLPERLGGVRNWDYRCCWLRDATFTLYALMQAGHVEETRAWRDWLLRAVAGAPSELQIMYGPSGERRLTEHELGWLPGYEGSRPVRVGNAAASQLQLDVYGEVMDALHLARRAGIPPDRDVWNLQKALLGELEGTWREPDEGIWEVRGPRRHFTHSKVMAWVAFDRAVTSVERFGLEGPAGRWRELRDEIHRDVCRRGYDPDGRTFVQSYGERVLDAALLMIPLVGFLPASDPRVRGTVAAIERELVRDGLVLRYPTEQTVDGLPPGEGAFLPCSFWLADSYALLGRRGEARALFERLLAIRNDVGLLAEEYDPRAGRQLGNFPQAFSHVMLVNTARNLAASHGPAEDRQER